MQYGNNKFRSNMIAYQVKKAIPIPPSAAETTSPHPPATPAEIYGKNRYQNLNQMFSIVNQF